MTPKQLNQALNFLISNRFPALIKGQPGVGKSDIVAQVCKDLSYRLIVSHPVVSDPTDYKGLPFVINGEAHFLPFGELNDLINATEPTVYFLDDLGQATPAVQSAVMQLLLARRINGHRVSDFVTFVAATNRREDKANVTGILEPVKSRFASILELTVDPTTDNSAHDWAEWALSNGMPTSLVAFIQFRPALLNQPSPTRDIINSPSPRTVAAAGRMIAAGMPATVKCALLSGACGQAWAAEYLAFEKDIFNLPTFAQIVMDPINTKVPLTAGSQYALTGSLADKVSPTTLPAVLKYLSRMPREMETVCVKMVTIRNPDICETMGYIDWAVKNQNFLAQW